MKLFSKLALTILLVSMALAAKAKNNANTQNKSNNNQSPVVKITTTKTSSSSSESKDKPKVALTKEVQQEDVDPEYLKKKLEYYKKLSESRKSHSNSMGDYNKDLKTFDTYHKQSQDWIKKLKAAKTQKEYEEVLKGYQGLMANFKTKFKGCMPPPPPTPIKIEKAPVEDACHKGYRVGWKEGKNWAEIVTRDQGSFMDGEHKMQCLMDWMKKKSGSIYHICSIRGAKAGYAKWWNLLLSKNKNKLKDYKKLKEDEKEAIRKNLAYYKKLAVNLG